MSFPTFSAESGRRQYAFNPIDHGFSWVADGTPMGWYSWDRKTAHKAALAARNRAVKEAKAAGFEVATHSSPGSLVSRGGIGSGRPHIEEVVTVYCFDVLRQPANV
jgi:hypothetical protein